MLEVKSLFKTYTPKRGIAVTALNGISLKFGDTGLVFVLGKSGSGKSTLLNVMGGLDGASGGEIIVDGRSSYDFSAADFDSFRNTCVGFIFQEYNLLPEFTVGQNVSLAIELQGRKAAEGEIAAILKEVGLEGCQNRKPNELSGGQKQRVAIARALVKNPRIIFADEPTGALDSATGLQVFETLKQLSRDKLVVVVSHDRDFALSFGDRVIELKDGKVVSDIEKSREQIAKAGISVFGDELIYIKKGYELSDEDVKMINERLKAAPADAVISLSGELNGQIKRTARLSDDGAREVFAKTDESRIANNGEGFKPIKSKLPLKSALKMGAGSLKVKPLRLVFTIFLSVAAFVLFGLADTFSAYDKSAAAVGSIIDNGVRYATFVKKINSDLAGDGFYPRTGKIDDDDLVLLHNETGLSYLPSVAARLDIAANLASGLPPGNAYYAGEFNGQIYVSQEQLEKELAFRYQGKMPVGRYEAAISDYLAQSFLRFDYVYENGGGRQVESIGSATDLIGKKLQLPAGEFTITAIIDTGFDGKRYAPLREAKLDETFDLGLYMLNSELIAARTYGFDGMLFVSEDYWNFSRDLPGIPLGDGSCLLRLDIGGVYYEFEVDRAYKKEDSACYSQNKPLLPTQILISTKIALQAAADMTIIRGDATVSVTDLVDEALAQGKSLGAAVYEVFVGNDIFSRLDKEAALFLAGSMNPQIVGVFESQANGIVVADTLYEQLTRLYDGRYNCAVAVMPRSRSAVKRLVAFNYDNFSQTAGASYFQLANDVLESLDQLSVVFETVGGWFLYAGLFFAVFAALMMLNFITASIVHKKREISVLRAVGARGKDVFLVFFSEAFIIGIINFILSASLTALIAAAINRAIRHQLGLLLTVLSCGIRQLLLLFAVSLIVAFAASFLPVWRFARKQPIDAINNR